MDGKYNGDEHQGIQMHLAMMNGEGRGRCILANKGLLLLVDPLGREWSQS
jgi:hypothetical protein